MADPPRGKRRSVYHIVETSTVTEDILEQIINEEIEQGWAFDGIQFAMREASKRPAMAFLLFTKQERKE